MAGKRGYCTMMQFFSAKNLAGIGKKNFWFKTTLKTKIL